ncbi:MAG TPA: RAMP superfamily CRISPR-associated protein [Verrucomicrobiota bacterium]|nr:RAMP superfamily CRISPR-associated protein [Verrucomicrobiota bacterium]
MTIYDYNLSIVLKNKVKYEDWKRGESYNLNHKTEEDKYNIWLNELLSLIGKNKSSILSSIKNKDHTYFYPSFSNILKLSKNSVLIKIIFTLKKPYTSKDEGEFHIIGDKINENPIVRDRFTGLPMVKPSTWKGHLRFAAGKVENCPNDTRLDDKEKEKIIKRLFGSEPGENKNQLRGRLHFFPTFFKETPARDVITPLKRDTRTPARGPINFEVVKPNSTGEFYLLYIPYPRGEDFNEQDVDKDLDFLASALYEMFYTYGFSAKKTSGFGVINTLNEGNIMIEPSEKKKMFSILYTKANKNVNHSERK